MLLEPRPLESVTEVHKKGEVHYGDGAQDRDAHKYAQALSPRLLLHLLELISSRRPNVKRVVDFGSGKARFVRMIRDPESMLKAIESDRRSRGKLKALLKRHSRQDIIERLKLLESTGIDVQYMREHPGDEFLVASTVHEPPLASGTADYVASLFVLPYVVDPLGVINQMMRVAKPNARIRAHIPAHLVFVTAPEHHKAVLDALKAGPQSMLDEKQKLQWYTDPRANQYSHYVDWLRHYMMNWRKENGIPVLFLDEYLRHIGFKGTFVRKSDIGSSGVLRFRNKNQRFNEKLETLNGNKVLVMPTFGSQVVNVYSSNKIRRNWKKYIRPMEPRPFAPA